MTTDHDRLLERMESELEQWDRAGLGDLGGVSRDIRLLIERVKEAEAAIARFNDWYSDWQDTKSRLRAAEEVVEVVRAVLLTPLPFGAAQGRKMQAALNAYDEAVARVKE